MGKTYATSGTGSGVRPAVRESIRRTADRALGGYDRELTKRTRDHKEVFDFIDPDLGVDDIQIDRFRVA